MSQYQGKSITVLRPARQGDDGFKNDGSEQSFVRMDDGTEKSVPKSEIKG